MISKEKVNSSRYLIILGLILIIGFSACSTQANTGTAASGAANGQEDSDFDVQIPLRTCPTEKTLFTLWFSHLAVLDNEWGDGETFYLKFENVPPSFFDLWIDADGTVTNEGIFSETPIGYYGEANYPDDNDCPVQIFEGVWQMRAKISGVCENGIVRIHIIEEWLNPVLHSSCEDPEGLDPGLTSAPELNLVFDLSSDFPADGITIPEGGPFHASYDYALYPAGYELPVVPLVPEQ